jgi:hypothetical protein
MTNPFTALLISISVPVPSDLQRCIGVEVLHNFVDEELVRMDELGFRMSYFQGMQILEIIYTYHVLWYWLGLTVN